MYVKKEAETIEENLNTDESFLQNLTTEIEDALDERRFRHTLSVAHTASCLAMRYEENPYRAYLAGLLHDCAKCLKNKKKLELATKYGIGVNAAEEENPDLLHAKLGSVLAREKYGIDDEQILSAIRYHTTGRPDMTKLEKIIYIADYIEIHRKPLPLLEKARNVAFFDLDEAMQVILESTLNFLGKKGAMIDPITYETYNFYQKDRKD